MPVPQTDLESYARIGLHIKNQGSKTWFEYAFDMKKSSDIEGINGQIADKRNLFAFLVFKGIKEETAKWLENNGSNPHYGKINSINSKAGEIFDMLKQEHGLNDYGADKYRKQVPQITVRTRGRMFSIVSEDWFEEWIGQGFDDANAASEVERLNRKIKESFEVFRLMVLSQISQEIRSMLFDIEQASFKDRYLRGTKAAFDKRVTMPILDLEEWIYRVGRKMNPGGVPNPDYILGMEDLTKDWDLTLHGRFAQAYVTRKLSESAILKVLGVENRPYDYGKNPATGKKYDADLCLRYGNSDFPVQVSAREGELARELSKPSSFVGEKPQATKASTELGGVNVDYGKRPDFEQLCKKLERTPPDGILLWVSLFPLLPMSGLVHLKEWYGRILDKKCVVLWESNKTLASIHHNNTGFDLAHAEKLCNALGVAEPSTHTDSPHSLDRDFLDMGAYEA